MKEQRQSEAWQLIHIINFQRTKTGADTALPFLFISFGNYQLQLTIADKWSPHPLFRGLLPRSRDF